MKSIFKNFAFIAAAALIFSSCGKDYIAVPTEVEAPNPMRGSFEAMYNDEFTFTANEKVVRDTTVEGSRSITIYAREYNEFMSDSSYRVIILSVANFQGPGTYAVDWYTTGTSITNVVDNNIYNYLAVQNEEGSHITFTQAGGGKYEGSFQFNAKSTNSSEIIKLTNGTFSIPR